MVVVVDVTDGKSLPVSKQRQPRRRRNPAPKPKQRSRPARKKPVRTALALRPFSVSEGDQCLIDYGRAYDKPFNHAGVCIPTYPSWPSRKLLTRQYGYFTVGANGLGYVAFQPVASNDLANIAVTNYSYTGIDTSGLDIGPDAAVTQQTNTASPYTNAQFSNAASGLQCRIALAALRVKYVGTDLNMSGSIFPVTNINSATVQNVSYANLRAYNSTTSTEPINRGWHTTRWLPTNPDQAEYTPTSGNTIWPMAIIVAGFTTSGGGLFEFEAVTHAEIVGRGIDLTPSYSTNKWPDFSSAATTISAKPTRTGGMAKVAEQIVHAGTPYLEKIARAGVTHIGNAVMGRLGY